MTDRAHQDTWSPVPQPRFRIEIPWRKIFREKAAVAGGLFVLLVIFVALAASIVAPYPPDETGSASLLGPSLEHPFGTDQLGRDVFSRMIHGARISPLVGFISAAVAIGVGVPLGLVAGYFKGKVETLIMRTMDALMSFPGILLALMIAFVLGPSMTNLMIAVGIVFTPTFARLVHGQALSLRERDFVAGARVVGASDFRIIMRHILPNTLSPVIVQGSLILGWAILIEASLSYIGLGVRPPNPSWGSMIRQGYTFFHLQPWAVVGPGLAISMTVLAMNMLGDGLRSWLDPRQRRSG